jgi:hypothetical protein
MRILTKLNRVAAVLAASLGLLQACSEAPKPVAGPRLPVYAADLSGAAKQCEAGKPALSAKQTADTAMKLSNDGGWCGVSASDGGKPFAAGLLTARPAHGKVLIHQVGDNTRVDYVPDLGYIGPDTFTVTLLPGEPALRVAVTVTGAPAGR